MTPKEKAKELVYKMSLATDEYGYINTNVHRHKQCALITVDEMLKEPRMFNIEQIEYSDKSHARSYYEVPNKFWQQVKKEIEKL